MRSLGNLPKLMFTLIKRSTQEAESNRNKNYESLLIVRESLCLKLVVVG